MELYSAAAARIAAETERLCHETIARGPGHRLWRSDARFKGTSMTVDFQILPPGYSAPGTGTIYGPWPVTVGIPTSEASE